MDTLGARIKKIRGQMPQRQFAEVLGIPQTTLANYESNKAELNFRMIDTFISKFKVNTDWLLFGRGSMRSSEDSEPDSSSLAISPQALCERCSKLEAKLDRLDEERRELAAENRQLWKENGQLREKVARLEEAAHKPGILNESAASTGAA